MLWQLEYVSCFPCQSHLLHVSSPPYSSSNLFFALNLHSLLQVRAKVPDFHAVIDRAIANSGNSAEYATGVSGAVGRRPSRKNLSGRYSSRTLGRNSRGSMEVKTVSVNKAAEITVDLCLGPAANVEA